MDSSLLVLGFLMVLQPGLTHRNTPEERLPPNVNPQHYQQQPPSQPPPPPPPPSGSHKHQKPPPPPPPPQPSHGQVAGDVSGRDHHGHHAGGQRPLQGRQNLAEEREHIKEHMDIPLDTSGMSEQELQFHYFKMHDADNNNKLDGCELVKSLIHWHDPRNHDPRSGMPVPESKVFTDQELIEMIDPILQADDRNRDGFIDYPEFVRAQQSAAAAAKPPQ